MRGFVWPSEDRRVVALAQLAPLLPAQFQNTSVFSGTVTGAAFGLYILFVCLFLSFFFFK